MFLQNSESIAAQVRALIAEHFSTTPISIAVAFWGRGAETLFVNDKASYRVICNLRAGGTNPDVIRLLEGMENVDIRQLDTLHAKVIVAGGGGVVSSANFSTNGLGLEGESTATWIEAGVFVSGTSPMFQAITDWFSVLWGQSQSITDSDLRHAEDAWARRTVSMQPDRDRKVPEKGEVREQDESTSKETPPLGTWNIDVVPEKIGGKLHQLRIFANGRYIGEYEKSQASNIERKKKEIDASREILIGVFERHGEFVVRWDGKNKCKSIRVDGIEVARIPRELW